ncbi:MAG: FAD-binding oxidoreductase [Novosphingobium sp.]
MSAPDSMFTSAAAALLGPRGWTEDAEVLAPWLTDWRGRYTGRARGMASPADTEQVAALVRLCAQHRVAIVAQGGNSGMSGGATPDDSGDAVLLSLRRLDRIGEIDAAAQQVTCGAGVILQKLHEAAEREGLRFPLTLGGKGSATIGGLISTNAGGTQVLRHGSMRAQVLGLEVVTATGSVWSSLTPLKKDNRGFDLKQLFIGSEGTLGIVTAATLKLQDAVAQRRVAWAGLPSIGAARVLLTEATAALGNELEGFEVLPQTCLDAVLAANPSARAPLIGPHPWHALIEVVSPSAEVDLQTRLEDLLAQAMGVGTIGDAAIATSEAQADAFWTLRDSISGALRAKGAAVQHDISVPAARMADFIAFAIPEVERAWPGCGAFAFGHLGDGNVHFHVTAPQGATRGEWEADQGKAISRHVHDLVTEWHGSISAEHGIGQMKRDELARLGDPVALWLMSQVKAALDPLGLLNPGKLLAPRGSTA